MLVSLDSDSSAEAAPSIATLVTLRQPAARVIADILSSIISATLHVLRRILMKYSHSSAYHALQIA